MDDKIKEVMGLVKILGGKHYAVGVAEMQNRDKAADKLEAEISQMERAIESKLRELVPVWLPIESAEKPAIGSNGFGERVLLLVDCGDGTLKSTKIGWWCDKWMMDTGGSVKENGYRAIGWMPQPKEPTK